MTLDRTSREVLAITQKVFSVRVMYWRGGWANNSANRCDNALKVRFSATLGEEEPEVEVGLV